jgi:histidinol-phosphatase
MINDLDLALKMADHADEIALKRFRAVDLLVETKPDRSPVTDADKAVEASLRQVVAEYRPEDSFIGEEFENTGSSSRNWIVDPIDGTANYLRGVPIWATLIALRVDGVITTSVVSAPALGRRWWAHRGNGAFTREIDGSVHALQVSRISKLDDSSISYNNMQLWDQAGKLPQLIELSRKVWRTRAYGDFYSYMLLSEGSIDLVAEHDLKIYDIAALVPIVEEAGGRISDLSGPLTDQSSSVMASNGLLHADFQQALK